MVPPTDSGSVDAAVPGEDQPASDAIFTVPNILSALRLVGVPIFLWALVRHHDGLALALLAASGITDYLDGKIARAYGLVSRIGQLLDPIADRLYIVSTVLGFAWREIIPWWLVAVLLGRELFMAGVTLVARRHGLTALPVHFIGKAATFNLLYAFPVLLLGEWGGAWTTVARPIGWGFVWWGTVLYWVAAVLYVVQLRDYIARRAAVAA